MAAARPVLDSLADDLAGSRFSVLLADRDSRIVARRFGHPALANALDEVRAAPGHEYLEQTTGTNALATAFELRRGIAVSGEEHFLDSLKQFCCYGHPLLHPLTGQLVGVLDLTGYAADATPLLAPVLTRAAADIQQRLLHGSRLAEQRMLAAFQGRATRTRAALLAIGEGLTLANDRATRLFDGPTMALLRNLVSQPGPAPRELTLADGRNVRLQIGSVPGADNAVLVEATARTPGAVVPRGRRATAARSRSSLDQWSGQVAHRDVRDSVLVHGEPGSGRRTTALQLAGAESIQHVTAAELAGLSALDALAHSEGTVVIEDVHLLSSALAHRLAALLESRSKGFVLTSNPVAQLRDEHRALAARCPIHIATVPLRARRADLVEIANTMLAGLRPDVTPRLAVDAIECLLGQPWPGNLGELKAVLTHVAGRLNSGTVRTADLPPRYRIATHSRTLGVLQQAERAAIVTALRDCQGNKVHAAAALGIGRTTLYRRLKALGIPAETGVSDRNS